ncbi:hypothetical protein ONZ43_g1627 [Nemania bipapillata]|uniref:Uncharacterized protein n=1 Tax=Nemania bipapillata TaxID=110536 RepID=A0ACC2J3R1_9PEZI|nr:hypothetical protein ONZ43_g1627 [Nemania bipapillata]
MSDSNPDSEYDSDSGPGRSPQSGSGLVPTKWKDELTRTIDAIEACGEFATRKQYSQFANPGLQIGDTLIALPLDPAQVPLIRDASRQAPFGRRDKTLVDTSVRDTWEIDASKFHIANPAWATFVHSTLQDVAADLGMSGVKTELYKLLLYEKGSFFKRHKDSEKAPGMVATLSICLPSRYKGGEVHLSHAGKNRAFDTSQSLFDIFALAWYADVTHEIKPIEDGHRLVLIYNIMQTGDGVTSASFLTRQDEKLQKAISKLNSQPRMPKRLLYFLEHQYSQASLRIDHLKGRDRAVGQTLREACTRSGWYMFLCNVTKTESNAEDYERYSSCYYDEEKVPELVIDTVATCSAQVFASNIELNEKEILGSDPYSDFRGADSESEGEETGNEGATMEYRYHDSAVIIVPKDQLHQFFRWDVEMNVLFDLVMNDLKAHPKDPATLQMAIGFFSKAVNADPTLSPAVLQLAWRIKNESLFRVAVHAGFSDGVPDLGAFLSGHRNLTTLSKSLDLVRGLLGPGDLQTSFQQWRATRELLNLEGKKNLTVDDHDSVMELVALQWENTDWIKHTLVPKIRNCSDKNFLSKFTCSLLEKAIALLEVGVPNLCLARVKFNSTAGDEKHWMETNRFCSLLDECLLSGLQQYVDDLLRRSLATITAAPVKDGSSVLTTHRSAARRTTLAEEMLGSICEDFEKSKMPPSQPARDFVIAVLKKFVLTDLPKCPQQPEGFVHQQRGCGKCQHCQELDDFLVSPREREREFLKGPRIRTHMESRLPSHLFQCTAQNVTQGKKQQYLLKVVKLGREHEVAIDAYNQDLRYILTKVQPFRTEYMKQLLGDDAYGELIMLANLPHPEDLGPSSGRGTS